MSTHSSIGIKNNDGTVIGIYCHHDGYLHHCGAILKEFYNDVNKAKELIALGDLSALENKISPDNNEEHSFDKPQKGVCIFYHRDRQEDWESVKPNEFNNDKDFVRYYGGSSYYYLFDDGKWYYKNYNAKTWSEL